MAKLILIAAFCLLGAAITKAAASKDEIIKTFMTRAAECQEEVGSAPSDIDDMIKAIPAAGKEGKCLRSCLMKKYGVMDEGGKFVKAVALEHIKDYTDGDAEKMKIATEIADTCEKIAVPDDHCEAAETYGKCFMENAKAHGIDKFEF